MDEQDLRILGGLPHQLGFLHLHVHSIAEVVCNNNIRTDDEACLFNKLRCSNTRYDKGIQFLLPSREDSDSVSFYMRDVRACMFLEDTGCKAAAAVTLTLLPRLPSLWFTVYLHEFINHDDDCIKLALEYFASLQNVYVRIFNDDGSTAAEVERVVAALRRAVDVHPNRPTLQLLPTRFRTHWNDTWEQLPWVIGGLIHS
jgi:disease resistance protein RPM1